MTHLFKVGLTGGIASGKSTVARRWSESGAPDAAVIDTDQLAHRTLEPRSPVWRKVVDYFGRDIVNPDGTIDRRRLGELVFSDPEKRQALNQMVHPAVRQMWHDSTRLWEHEGRFRSAIVVIPLLYETGAETEFDRVVVVACHEQTQRQRLAAMGLTDDQARARLRAQWPTQQKIDRADYVIWNDGTLQTLSNQADLIWSALKENQNATTQN